MKLVMIAFLASCWIVSGAESSAPDSSDLALINGLHSENPQTRELAEKRLLERAEYALPLIEVALQKSDLDPEYKLQLGAIREKLKAFDPLKAFDNPLRIDLEMRDVTAAEALAQIKKHFGKTAVLIGTAAQKKCSLTLKGATFFEALDALRKAANLAYDSNALMKDMYRQYSCHVALMGWSPFGGEKNDNPPINLIDLGDKSPMPAAATGPVLIFISWLSATTTSSLDFAEGRRQLPTKSSRAAIFVVVEPELRYSGISIHSDLVLPGENAKSKNFCFSQYQSYWGCLPRDAAVQAYQFDTRFSVNGSFDKAKFVATATLHVPLKMREQRIEAIASLIGKPQLVFGETVTINSLDRDERRKEGQYWKINYELAGALGKMLGATESGVLTGSPSYTPYMELLDESGQQMWMMSEGGNGGRNQLLLKAPPKTLLFRRPEGSATRTFSLEIPGVDLP